MTDDLGKKRRQKAMNALADAALESVGWTVDELAAAVGEAPDAIQKGMLESLQRQKLYQEYDAACAAKDRAAGRDPQECHNVVCRHHAVEEYRCLQEHYAGGCTYNMRESPPNDLDCTGEVGYPSHAEAIRMLQRAGLLAPDEFGRWNGTDFALHKSTRRLWWAFVALLVETGRAPRVFREGEVEPELCEATSEAKKWFSVLWEEKGGV